MIRRVGPLAHFVVAAGVGGVTAITGFGVIGAGDQALLRPEHFDAKRVVVQPAGGDGVRVREVVDIDFGVTERRGYQREIPNDFGEPVDITASTPDANGQLNVVGIGRRTRIRIGDPDITFTGQRRYILDYTLPDAGLSDGDLALDIIGTDETFTTDRFEVVLSGFELENLRCDVGSVGDIGGCDFEQLADDEYLAVIEPLKPGDGITVGGSIVTAGREAPAALARPALPDRNPTGFRPLGLAALPLGLLTAAGVFVASRRYGSNEVHGAGGAAEAAYGDLPVPRRGDRNADVPTYRVPDSRLADLATIEFVPPRGIEPWQGAVLLTERVDDDTVSSWFSEMIAAEAMIVEGDTTLRRGPGAVRLSAVDQAHIDRLFRSDDAVTLGTYDPGFKSAWSAIAKEQKRFVADSGWWVRGAPGAPSSGRRVFAKSLMPLVFVVVFFAGPLRTMFASILAAGRHPLLALVLGVLLVGVVAFLGYRSMLPSRSATGSALTLRTESFRRFLVASEGRHVEWAWDNGLLREYSAWAVALGAADAWKEAIESSNVTSGTDTLTGPLFVHTAASSFRSARVAPSSSGGGSGSGFSGGGVGGGGGGGSSGSW